MVGRPLSAYAYPNIWGHVRELGFTPTARALVRLRNNSDYREKRPALLTARTITDKFDPDAPMLVDHGSVHEAVDLISFYRVRKGLAPLQGVSEVKHFNYQIVNLRGNFPNQGNANGSPIDVLAQKCSLPPCTVAGALGGRLVPLEIGARIVQQAGGNPNDNLIRAKPSAKTPPLNDIGCLSRLLPVIATVRA